MIRDITRRIGAGFPAWPGDPPFAAEPFASLERGDPCDLTRLSLSAHAGTHLDAPAHVVAGAGRLESIPLDLLVGPAEVVSVPGEAPIPPEALGGDLLERLRRGPADPAFPLRLLLRTGSAETLPALPRAFASLEERAAELLARSGVRLIGIDTPSVDAPSSTSLPVHRILGRAGVAVLEWLDLVEVRAGLWFLVALPLRLEGVEASPVRAILMEPGTGAATERRRGRRRTASVRGKGSRGSTLRPSRSRRR